MDPRHFDALAKQVGSRRTAIGAFAAGFLLPLGASARNTGKARKHRQRKGKGQQRKPGMAQAEACWRTGACVVSKGSNVSQCDLEDYIAADGLDCTRCNLSRANLRGADFTGVNFTRANLSGACLIDADFTDATFTNSTNLYGATFCRTTMPDGNVNNSGCGSGSACCPICTSSADCGAGRFCCNGSCAPCPCGQTQLSNGTCVKPCSSAADCGPSGSNCGCFGQTGYCGTDATGIPCPGGNRDCPLGQFCNVFNRQCTIACDEITPAGV